MSLERIPREPGPTIETIKDTFREKAFSYKHGVRRFVATTGRESLKSYNLPTLVKSASEITRSHDRTRGFDRKDPNPHAFRRGAEFGATIGSLLYGQRPGLLPHITEAFRELLAQVHAAEKSHDNAFDVKDALASVVQQEGSMGLARFSGVEDLIDVYINELITDTTAHGSFKTGAGFVLNLLARAADIYEPIEARADIERAAGEQVDWDAKLIELLETQ